MDPKKIQRLYKRARDDTTEWRQEARDLYDLVACKQWTDAEEAELKSKERLPIVMNRIAPFIKAIQGQQINNRKEVRYMPREISDAKVADLYTEAGRWADDLCSGEDEVSDAFYDLLICGMGWTETRMDYAEDPQGRLITAERIDPLEMYWDTNDTARNLEKSGWVIRSRKYPTDEAEARWPKIKKVVAEWATDEDTMRSPHDAQNAWKYETDQSDYSPSERSYVVLQCQYYEDKPVYRIADPESGQIVTMPTKRFDTIREYLDSLGVRYVKATERKYYQCFVSGETELEKTDGPSQKGFTLKCMTGDRDRNKRVWYGPVRALKDPQKFANKFFSDITYILATNRKGGAFVEIDALADPRKAEEQWASPNALIKLNPGGLDKIRERDAGVFPAGLDRLMQYAIDAVPATSGLNPEMIGMADRAQAGILEAQRKQSALVILSPLFDALKRHQRSRGRIVLDFLHRFIADGRAIRITNPEGQTQNVPFMPAPDADTYDIIVDEMPTTPNSKAETFAVLAELVPFMAKMGVMPPPDILDYLPLPATLVEKWKGQVMGAKDQEDPAQQMEQAKLQAQQAEMQAKSQLEMLKMQFEREKAGVTMQSEQAQAAMQERQMQFESAIKAQEAQIKAAELELKRAELAIQAQQAQEQISIERRNSSDLSGGLSEAVGALKEAMQALKDIKAQGDTKATLQALLEALVAPREVVRDDRGRAVGTRVRTLQ